MKTARRDLLTRRRFTALLAAVAATCAGAGAGASASAAEHSDPTTTATTTTDEAATTAPAGSQPASAPSASVSSEQQIIDAGPIDQFKAHTLFDKFRTRGFFLIHRDEQLFALSSTCTHRGCTVRVADDQSFYCRCHGSRYDANGKVTHGPAKQNLPRLAVAESQNRHVMVNLDPNVEP